ncbi:hypothetical protein DF3PB_3110003 [uncultured Defluviicoccus sp.]|uniref:Uncharacterized protein n=1 Tax=metagenome TaxID=256318 RepID=A0A380TG87_9ZZZZ|nr:hypothetical protein DF3PB_3110003 [uncultured Defluviicoccus sp.]
MTVRALTRDGAAGDGGCLFAHLGKRDGTVRLSVARRKIPHFAWLYAGNR